MTATVALASIRDLLEPEETAMSNANPKFCAECGATLAAGAKFCPECGEKLSKVVFCTECGAEQKDGAKFCAECGHKL